MALSAQSLTPVWRGGWQFCCQYGGGSLRYCAPRSSRASLWASADENSGRAYPFSCYPAPLYKVPLFGRMERSDSLPRNAEAG